MKTAIDIPEEAKKSRLAHDHVFRDAGGEYLEPPVTSMELEALTRENAYDVIARKYFGAMEDDRWERVDTIRSEMYANDDREVMATPDVICCIPVAASDELSSTLDTLLNILSKQENANTTEFVLYGNYPDSLSVDSIDEALQKLPEAVERSRSQHPDLMLRYVTVRYDEETMSISQIRKDMVDVVAADAAYRGLDYAQPVVWVDADLTGMREGSLRIIAEEVRGGRSLMPHLITRMTVEGLKASSPTESTVAQRAAGHYEILRRQKFRDNQRIREGYIEEPGLGFAMGDYILVGGVNQGDPVNESTWLEANFNRFYSIVNEVRDVAFGRHTQPEILKYLKGTGIFTSARRLVDTAQKYQDWLVHEDGHAVSLNLGGAYGDFSHTEQMRKGLEDGPGGLGPGHNVTALRQFERVNKEALGVEAGAPTRASRLLMGRLIGDRFRDERG